MAKGTPLPVRGRLHIISRWVLLLPVAFLAAGVGRSALLVVINWIIAIAIGPVSAGTSYSALTRAFAYLPAQMAFGAIHILVSWWWAPSHRGTVAKVLCGTFAIWLWITWRTSVVQQDWIWFMGGIATTGGALATLVELGRRGLLNLTWDSGESGETGGDRQQGDGEDEQG